MMMIKLEPVHFSVASGLLLISIIIILAGKISVSAILDKEFSYKATIECFDKTGTTLVGKTSSKELYSAKERRGVIKLLVANDNSRTEFYYDANLDAWIEVFPEQNLCISSSQYDLHLHLYESTLFSKMNTIFESVCSECSNDDIATKHLIGTARLLLLVQKLRYKFGKPIDVATKDPHVSVYHWSNLKVDESSSIELFVHYNKILDFTSRFSDKVQPQFVQIHYKSNEGDGHIIGVRFYQFELLSESTQLNQQDDELSVKPFAFPSGMYCSRALGATTRKNKQQEVLSIQKEFQQVQRVSFSMQDLDYPTLETFHGLDLRAKLIRRDFYIDGLQSTTMIDLKDKLKYHIIRPVSGRSLSATRTVQAKCVKNKIQDKQDPILKSNELFINLEELVYLGKTKMNSIEALIFEEFYTRFSSSNLPFWILPPVWASTNQGDPLRFRADEIQGVQIYITYYFAAGLQAATSSSGDHEQRIGPLIRVEINVRDEISRLIWRKRLQVSGFIVGTLIEPRSTKLDQSKMFSLANICQLEPQQGQVSSILELPETPMRDINPILLDPNERNEILIEALNEDYDIRRTQINHLSSQLRGTDKFALELELTISRTIEQTLDSIECVYLGRGQLLGYDLPGAKNYTGVPTFEDCMLLAHWHLLASTAGEDVLFVYSDRDECFVDRLYRYRSLDGHEAVSAGSNKATSLNYFPYQYGTKRIFTIRKTTEASSALSQRGMHFFQVGSLRMLGRSLDLRLPTTTNNDDELRCKFNQVHLSGYLATRASGGDLHPRSISGLSWSERDAKNSLTNVVAFVESPTYLNFFLKSLGSQMNEASCQSLCLLDMSCNSYSICDRFGDAQCLISSIDVSKSVVMKQLENLKDNLSKSGEKGTGGNRWRKATIMFDEGSLQQPEVEVILDRTCSISSKSYSDLFKQIHPVRISATKMLNSIDRTVKNKDDCAKRCLARNSNYPKELASLKLAQLPTAIYKNDQNLWESIGDRARGLARDLCTSFLYSEDLLIANDNSTVHGCLLLINSAGDDEPEKQQQQQHQHLNPTTTTTSGGTSSSVVKPSEDKKVEEEVKIIQPVSMIQHKLVYSHLFRRLSGVRIIACEEEARNSERVPNYKELLESHLRGSNNQIKLPMDDVEFCARACILQIHGPRPMCSSFDFVHERSGNIWIKYCLLNSQSLYDMRQRGLIVEQQIVYEEKNNSRFWHFEPRDADIQSIHKIFNLGDKTLIGEEPSGAFTSISLIPKILGLISGLVIGIVLTNYILEVLNRVNEPHTSKGRAARLIHRLSGVSLRSNLREIEVQMS